MAIKIKRSLNAAAPGSLEEGQLAYTFHVDGDQLYIGAPGETIRIIGGKKYVDMLENLTSDDISDFANAVKDALGNLSLGDVGNVSVAEPSNDQVLTYNSTSAQWEAKAIPSGVTSFIALNDTPSAFTNKASHWVKVNSAANALEFVENVDDGTF